MNFDFTNGGSTLYHEIKVDADQTDITLPEGLDLARATLVRDGMDLLINAQQGSDAYFIPNYFRSETLADLRQSDGHVVFGNSLEQVSDINAQAQYAQAAIPGLEFAQSVVTAQKSLGEPIGRVESVEGAVSVLRADGTTATMELGDAVYQGDRITTASQGGVGITLADTSSFSLGEESEMVLDELVYDPGSQEGRSVFSLLEGTTSYVSGQIAKINPDAVSITTPVATIGIRGTKIYLEYQDGQFRAVNLLETTLNGETPGEIVIFAPDGTPLGSTNQANVGWSWQGGSENIGTTIHFSPSVVEQLTRGVLRNLPQSLAEKAVEAKELEQALKDAAEIALREAREAEEQAVEAEQQAEELEQKAVEAKLAAEALNEQALSEEEKLKLLQLQLEQLIQSGASSQEIFNLQQALSKLEFNITTLWQNVDTAKQVALNAEDKALTAYQFMLEAKEEAYRANEVAEIAKNAMREAQNVAQTAFQQAQSYIGYQANWQRDNDPQPNNTQTYAQNNSVEPPQSNVQIFITTSQDEDNTSQNTLQGSSANDTFENEPEEQVTPQNNPVENTPTVSVGGKAVDGYLSGATVFIDRDKDGVLDAGEASTTTDSKGNFSLSGQANDYVISMIGGTDIATGKAFYGVLQAPAGSTVVTPLTTLLANGVSEATLKSVFGLDSSISLTSTDPVAGATSASGAKLAAIGVQIQNTILQAASAIEGAASNDLDNGATGGALFTALASAINSQGSGFDIASASNLQSVINTAAGSLLSGAELTKANDAAANTAQIISSSNQVINTYIAQGGTGDNFLSSLAQVAVVANDAAGALRTTVTSGGDLSALQNQYSSASLNSKIEGAAVGDVNGDGATNTVNAAPTLSGNVSLSTNEDQALTVSAQTLLAQASDTDALSVRNLSATNASVTDNNNGTWTITPTTNSTADITLSYNVSDGFKSVATTATISVNAVNDVPVASNSSVNVAEGAEAITGTLNATDVEDANLSYMTSSQIAGFSLNSNGSYSFDPTHSSYNSLAKGQTQTLTINFSVYDSDEASDSGTLTITLTGTNDAPTVSSQLSFTNDELTPNAYQEDKAFTLTKAQLLANASDVDGDTLDVLNVSVQSGGSVINNGDETWTVTPTANSTADIILTYTISDTKGGTLSQTATIDIDPVNDAPVVSNIVSLSGTEDNDLSITAEQLLAYASDVDGDTLSVTSITPSSGSISLDESEGGWIYEPVSNSTADVTFTYTISDGNGGTVQASAVADFAAVNDAPTVSRTPVALSGTEDNSVLITQSQLLTDYASDVDGDSLSIQNLATTAGGTLTNNGDNTWTYVPTAHANGTVNFTFKVSDGTTTTDGSAILTLAALNDAPSVSATPSFNTVAYSDGLSISSAQLLANASDVDGDTLSITDLTISGGSGNLSVSEDGWWFSSQTAGVVTLSYNVYDATVKTATSATITVQEAQVNNLAPTIGNAISLSGQEDGGQTGYIVITPAQLLAGATDDQDNVDDTLSIVNLAISSGGGSLTYDSTSGNWHYTPVLNSTSDVVFTYNVSDGVANSAQQSATLSLTAVNDAPVISNTVSLNGTEDSTLDITAAQLLANASDVDGDTLSVQNLSASSGTLVTTQNGWTFTPVTNSTANVTFSYVVSDGNGATVSTSAQATFSPVNDAPNVSGPVSLSGTEDATLTITKAQLLANATDVEGESLSVQGLSVGSGTLTYQGNDTWTYVPIGDFAGTVTFSYNVSDGTATTPTTAVATFAEDGTTEGTSGIDTIVGTSGNDTIAALAGADILTGGAGNDYLDGGEGDDTAIFSGNLADYTFSTNDNGQTTVTDNNTADGDDGTDVLVSIEKYQFADQTTTGVPGEILGTDGADFISGGNGVDIVSAGSGNDWVFTYSGNDTINGGAGDDIIFGGNGDDIINGDADDDWLWGGNGSDTITGGTGADRVYAGNSQDVIVLSNGDVTLDGGNSTDTLRLLNSDTLDFSSNNVELISIEIIDMLTDTSANHLSIGSSNITAMNSSDSVVIDGNASDSVTFLDNGWVQGATSNGYTTYDHNQSGAQASVAENISVTLN